MMLTDFYIAFALVVLSAAGGLIVWFLAVKPADRALLKVAAVLLMGSGLIGAVGVYFYGNRIMDTGCPYATPVVPQGEPAGEHGQAPARSEQETRSIEAGPGYPPRMIRRCSRHRRLAT
jgi:hypothetical protein